MIEQESSVNSFYAGQSVLITGGTGFLGKLLIEKLLRTCTEIKCIYALSRPKKGENAQRRFERIFEGAVFDRLEKEVPKYQQKVRVISGDCMLPGLGLSASDADLLTREVSVVFHVAATVRFDEELRKAIAVNVGGTKELMELCKRMPNLRVVMHVSTAYSNCTREDIGEKFYPAPMSEDEAMQLAQNSDDESNDLAKTFLGPYPNTYVYTKCIAEQLVRTYGKELPVGIFRPSIVVSTYEEPLVGWVDNAYGPTGALAAAGIGLLRTMNMDKDCIAELVPADYTVNALIVAAWTVATKYSKGQTNDPPIYNYHSSWGNGITWGQYMNLAMKHGKEIPSVRSVWCYTFTTAKRMYAYFILTAILHLLPAMIIDAMLILTGRKPRMLKIYRKVHKFSAVTSYFGMREWKFSYDNTKALWDSLGPKDRALYKFSMKEFDWNDFMYKSVRGLRLYILKDDPSTIPHAKLRMARFAIIHGLLKYTALCIMIWLFYRAACRLSDVFVANNNAIADTVLMSSIL
ncbi:fatty acyl-CoA reductase wat-like [Colletes gigas]|uniref:fatty acyl-CoA reductase wat-like n=1 Tax=Colletes gigas TaxID=935657 RepID=UPI001C9BA347|nr:fatty acyl-CoA reductase wat-like [Colletes gigas]